MGNYCANATQKNKYLVVFTVMRYTYNRRGKLPNQLLTSWLTMRFGLVILHAYLDVYGQWFKSFIVTHYGCGYLVMDIRGHGPD